MLSLLPVALLLLSAAALQVVGRVTRRAGSTWLLAAVFGFITWLSMILVGILLPPAVIIDNWLPQPYSFTSITFQLTRETWVLGFLLVSQLLAVIYFNSRYLETPNFLNQIIDSMVLSAFGLLAVLSRSPLAFVLSWSLLDLAEIGVLTAAHGNSREKRLPHNAVLLRALGIILLVLFMTISPHQDLQSAEMKPLMAWLLFITVLLRLGIFPILQHQAVEHQLRRGFQTLLRTLPLISAFAFMNIIPGFTLPDKSLQWALVALTIAALYGSLLWFFSQDELIARPYWFFAIGSLGMMAFLTNRVEALAGLAVVAVSTGTGIFLFSPRVLKRIAFLPFLLVGLLALPFTPTAALNLLFDPGTVSFYQILAVPAYALLLAGVIKHGFRKDDELSPEEPWKRLFHNISMYFIALAPWIIVGAMRQMVNLKPIWWLSLSILLLTAFLSALYFLLKKRPLNLKTPLQKALTGMVKGFRIIDQIFRLTWLAKLFSSIGFVVSKAADLLMRVLEGDGGLLWAFLFLVLLISLLIPRQAP